MAHLKPGAAWTHSRTLYSALFLLLIAVADPSCSSANPDTEEETVQLPDSLKTAQQFAQFGVGQMYVAWNFQMAGAALKKAVELDSDNSLGQMQYGWFLNLSGEDDKAAEHMTRATEAAPDNPLWQSWKAWHCMWMNEYACTEDHVKAALAIDSTFAWAYYVQGLLLINQNKPEEAILPMQKAYRGPQQKSGLSLAYARAGERDKALEILDTLVEAGEPFDLLGIAETYMVLGDQENAMQWLEKSYENRHPFFPWVTVNPIFDPVRENERFQELVGRLDLPGKAI